MSTTLNHKDVQSSQRPEFENNSEFNNQQQSAQNQSNQNNSSRPLFLVPQKSSGLNRKTSKRREAQQQKAAVLQLFKQLLSVVNQNFTKASEMKQPSQSKPTRVPRAPRMQKNSSKANLKKQDSINSNGPNSLNNNKSLKKEQASQVNQQSNNPIAIIQQGKPQLSKDLLQIDPVNAMIDQALQSKNQKFKDQIFENYSVIMKYLIVPIEQEQSESRSRSRSRKSHSSIQHNHEKSSFSRSNIVADRKKSSVSSKQIIKTPKKRFNKKKSSKNQLLNLQSEPCRMQQEDRSNGENNNKQPMTPGNESSIQRGNQLLRALEDDSINLNLLNTNPLEDLLPQIKAQQSEKKQNNIEKQCKQNQQNVEANIQHQNIMEQKEKENSK